MCTSHSVCFTTSSVHRDLPPPLRVLARAGLNIERGTVMSPELLQHFKTGVPATKRRAHTRSTVSTPLSKRRALHAETHRTHVARAEQVFCGLIVAKGFLLPGNAWNAEITCDANKCKDAVYSVVAKLSE